MLDDDDDDGIGPMPIELSHECLESTPTQILAKKSWRLVFFYAIIFIVAGVSFNLCIPS